MMGFWYCPTIASLCEQKKKKKNVLNAVIV